jgi:hypothetical protein
MAVFQGAPEITYAALRQDCFDAEVEEAMEQVRRLGYVILESGYPALDLQAISEAFG